MGDTIVPKTLEEHRQYLFDIVRLELWFVHHADATEPEADPRLILRRCVNIFAQTAYRGELRCPPEGHWDEHPDWIEIENRILELRQSFVADAVGFENAAFNLLRDSVSAVAEADFNSPPLYPANCGCFRIEDQPGHDGTIMFHIGNDCAPQSFLSDAGHVHDCLLRLVAAAAERGAIGIRTGSWLNSHPKFLSFFPPEWNASREVPMTGVAWHLGYWGQFINARGVLHVRNADTFRRTGVMPFAFARSCIDLNVMRQWLTGF